ncbi:Ig-like domain-containing protein [Nocardioides sp. LHG3406-4]|uniref:Ig-like domain-containing protein n=1 Tax=Nocardioides sp. LHG3406-4 TaxID=2804575 RepID=UPI003CEED9F2
MALALMAGGSLVLTVGALSPATADPATVPAAFTKTNTGPFSQIVPDGVCAVDATVRGGAGGSAINAADLNGSGADISATYRVVPGQNLNGTVGGGGGQGSNAANDAGAAGFNGGGRGGLTIPDSGTTYHHGAGGGGYSLLRVDTQDLILAGGGGGAGGGHATDAGLGGDAGLPTTAGAPVAGDNGLDGREDPTETGTVGGGQGGQLAAPGVGGVHSTDSTRNGFAGAGRTGGNGGDDTTPDAGGGGGGGYFGGGGGASTIGNGGGTPAPGGVGGAGGGGGASFIDLGNPSGGSGGPIDISSTLGPKLSGQGDGADGAVTLAWIPCDYDLAVTKTSPDPNVPQGGTITWTVTVTNNGPEPMTSGDLVTLVDSRAGANTTITAISTAGPGATAPSGLGDGPVTCDAAIGDPLTASLVCGRPYAPLGAVGSPTGGPRGLNVDETLTVTYDEVVANPGPASNTATVVDRKTGDTNDSATASVTVYAVTPNATNDTSSGPQGTPQTEDVLADDTPGDPAVPLVAGSLTLLDGNGNPVSSVTVPNQGTYTIVSAKIVFTPIPAFTGQATPVTYRIADTNGTTDTATYTPTVTPVAVPDTSTGPQGVKQTKDVLANDTPANGVTLDPTTLTLIDPGTGNPVTTVTVPNQGTYTVVNGKVDFQPVPTFTGVATTVRYQVDDSNGNTVESTYTPTVTPVAPGLNDDVTSGPQGRPQSVDPLVNDTPGDPGVPLVPGSLTLLDGAGDPATTVTVPEGTYKIVDGKIVFTPLPTFTGEATPVTYRVEDQNGTSDTATYTPTVTPVAPTAHDDATSGPQGLPQSVAPLANDTAGDPGVPLDPSTLTLLDGSGTPVSSLTIAGQGTYTVKDGAIVFTPVPAFTGTATPADYRVADVNGTRTRATYTPRFSPVAPVADPDTSSGPIGKAQSVDPFANDKPGVPGVPLVRESLTLLDRDGNPVNRVEVPDEGVYTVADGRLVFTPATGFTGIATPVTYRIADANGTTTTSTYTPTVLKPKVKKVGTISNHKEGKVGETLTVSTVSQIKGLVPGSVMLVGPHGKHVRRLVVPGEGVWTVNSHTGAVSFRPKPGFKGDPTPVKLVGNLNDGTPITGRVVMRYSESAPAPGGLPRTGADTLLLPVGLGGAALLFAGVLLLRRRRVVA